MVVAVKKGLDRVRELYQDRPQRAKELKAEGKKIIGYLCIYPVTEMMTALDLVPYRILGDMREPITKADHYLPTVVCPFLRSCLDLGLKGKYDFFDGVVTSHICDVGSSLSGIWNYSVKTPYHYHIDTPHTVHETSLEQLRSLLRAFQKSLEEFAGKKMGVGDLKKAIVLHNEQRALVRELYEFKKPDPPLISGAETLKVIKAIQSIPIAEGNALLREVIAELKTRTNKPAGKAARLMVWGSILDDTVLIEMVESLDANVVMDDTCVGSRPYFEDVPFTADPIDGLAHHYLVDIKCPRTFRTRDFFAARKNYMEDLKSRFSYLADYAREWKVNGVIVESVRYCDTHGYEVPGVRDYLKEVGLPSIYLEHDYTEGALAPLKTRVQGFLEIIG
ncbi:MAG: 2-hydroxyacyl-CoA dehydratase family protein [Dehalococcoidia bacterium]|nr:2-hydroxyacyl-CoA dehydratase family protein [Dehalococcoidia bacterium]